VRSGLLRVAVTGIFIKISRKFFRLASVVSVRGQRTFGKSGIPH
jgi:hypothetical protein